MAIAYITPLFRWLKDAPPGTYPSSNQKKLWWCSCGGGVMVFCAVIFAGVWCGGGGVLAVVFLWWCGGVFVGVWWCFCGIFVVVFLCFCGGVFVCFFWSGVDFRRSTEKLCKECWQHWCKKMSGIKVLLTLLISTLASIISFI